MNAPHLAHGPDNVPTAVRYLAELFADALGAVKFPDVDSNTLASSVAKVDALSADVTRLEEELARAKQAAESARDDLLRLAARAHAYARVFAEDDEGLRSRLDAITLPRARPRPTSSTNGAQPATDAPATAASSTTSRRKKKAAVDEEAPLFGEASSEPSAPEQAAAE